MAKFHGMIGYSQTTETAPGVHTEGITERACVGDIIRNTQSWEKSEHLNDNLIINNRFSVVADAFAYQNFPNMRYINWNGTKWKITSIEILKPRILLTVGGVYNG